MALTLTRKSGQSVVINGDITVTVQRMRGDRIKVIIAAPHDVPIRRQEVDAHVVDKKAG